MTPAVFDEFVVDLDEAVSTVCALGATIQATGDCRILRVRDRINAAVTQLAAAYSEIREQDNDER